MQLISYLNCGDELKVLILEPLKRTKTNHDLRECYFRGYSVEHNLSRQKAQIFKKKFFPMRRIECGIMEILIEFIESLVIKNKTFFCVSSAHPRRKVYAVRYRGRNNNFIATF